MGCSSSRTAIGRPKRKRRETSAGSSLSGQEAVKQGPLPTKQSHTNRFIDQISGPSLYHFRIKRQEKLEESYEMDDDILGTGINGEVRIGRHIVSGISFAIKTLPTQNISSKKASMLFNEVSIYLQLDHPNIARLVEVYEDERAVHLIMELCTGGELYDRLASKKRYAEKDAAKVTQQMLSAINYCHAHKKCHRDLKLENWVYADKTDDAPLKLIDFGFSRIFNPGVPMTAMHGTVYYVSPEVMDGAYSEECDIWSIGVIVYMLLSGSPPFNGTQDHEILAKIQRATFPLEGPRWDGISNEAKSFVSSLLRKNPEERASAVQALQHEWLHILDNERGDVANPPIDPRVLKEMQRFSNFNGIKRAALGVIALSMNSNEAKELEACFRRLDLNGKGTILLHELKQAMTEVLKIPEFEARKIFLKIDQTGDHEIHYSEFLAATFQAKFVLKESMIRDAFQKFDVDKSGFISLENLREMLGDVYHGTRVEDIVASCASKDKNVIDYEAFLQALTTDENLAGSDSASSNGMGFITILRKMSKTLLEDSGRGSMRKDDCNRLVVPNMEEEDV